MAPEGCGHCVEGVAARPAFSACPGGVSTRHTAKCRGPRVGRGDRTGGVCASSVPGQPPEMRFRRSAQPWHLARTPSTRPRPPCEGGIRSRRGRVHVMSRSWSKSRVRPSDRSSRSGVKLSGHDHGSLERPVVRSNRDSLEQGGLETVLQVETQPECDRGVDVDRSVTSLTSLRRSGTAVVVGAR